MKVLFDHKLFYQVYGGASKYFAMMINSLPKDSWGTTALFSCNEYAHAKQLFRTFPKVLPGQARVFEHLNRPYTFWKVGQHDYDVLHQTDFDNYFYSQLGDRPLVVTYHDANMSTFNPHPEIVQMQRKALERADAIIAVSNHTKKDLLNLFHVDAQKVHVIYHGIEVPMKVTLKEKPIAQPYILYVGVRADYKNFNRLIKAYALYHQKFPDVKLVCTSHPFSSQEYSLFEQYGVNDVVLNISANETLMNQLYQNALFFIYPSLYEGFGMPILEAWMNNCPVVLSDASCFPEICGDAGLYFNPNETEEMLASMIIMTEDDGLRKLLIEKGDMRVKEFSWERCAKEHEAVYKSLL